MSSCCQIGGLPVQHDHSFVAGGRGWMLTDPAGHTDDARRNRQRVADLLAVS